ncbi:MAG: hypothetical protein QNJ71_11790 [Acidimicrobiia bacterium]|nr:hypothetical protein [Acidimicrobiia bacterium]
MTTDTTSRPATHRRTPGSAAIVTGIAVLVALASLAFAVFALEGGEALEPADGAGASALRSATPASAPRTGSGYGSYPSPGERSVLGAELVALWNAGDMDAFTDRFQESSGFKGYAVTGSHVQRYLAFRAGVGDQLTIDACEPVEERWIHCTMTGSDALADRAERMREVEWRIEFSERNAVTRLETYDGVKGDTLVREMAGWVRSNQPDVWEDVFVVEGGCDDRSELDCMRLNPAWRVSGEVAEVLMSAREDYQAAILD